MTVNGGDWLLSMMTGIRPILDTYVSNDLKQPENEQSPTVGVQAKEPVLLLLIGHDVDEGIGPFGPVHVLELLQENLDLLSIGGVLSDEVETFGFFDGRGCLVTVEGVRHCSNSGGGGGGGVGAVSNSSIDVDGLEVTKVLCCSLSRSN